MKYFIRSVKYFFYLLVILTIILSALVFGGFVEADPSKMFINGYNSIWQICLMLAVFAAIYPRFGFTSRIARVFGSAEEVKGTIMHVMELHGYKLESENEHGFTFIKRSVLSRLLKMWEDRITIEPSASGLRLEGLTRDLVRLVSGLEAADRNKNS